MKCAGSLEYAHARIGARWGARADEALWLRIETTRDLAGVLALARGSALACWLDGLGPVEGQAGPTGPAAAHLIEHTLRRAWRARVAELAAWLPPAWQPALEWCAWLVDLPLAQALARGEPAPAWAAEAAMPAALQDAARAAPERTLAAWLALWRARLPGGVGGSGSTALVRELVPLLQAHVAALGAPGLVDAWGPRRALHARLAALLRRHVGEPVAAFAYLALSALELERLRGELVRRAAFPQRRPAA